MFLSDFFIILFFGLLIKLSECVVADFGAFRYQTEMVLMRATNLDIYYLTRHYV
jgi:hypothetical protein